MKDYANGPVSDQSRKRTDILCCILLFLFTLAMFGLAVYAWFQGNFVKLNIPYDPDGKGCGVDYPDYPYIFFASPHPDSLWVTVCVKKCPVEGETRLDCQPNSKVGCQPVNNADNQKAVQIYDSFALGPVCMPTSDKIQTQISSAISSTSIAGKIAEIGKAWKVILISIPIVIALSLIFMLVMRLLAGVFVYLFFILSIVAFIGFGIYLLIPQNSGNLAGIEMDRTFIIIVAAIFILLGIIILFLFICYRRRVSLAATMTKVAARFVQQNCMVITLPLVIFIIVLMFVALWIVEALGYYSLGIPQERQQKQLPFQHFQITVFVQIVLIVHVFHFFWVMWFLMETGGFIVSGTAVSWYYQRDHPFSQSRHRYFKFHMGSVAFGSFFLALLSFFKFLYDLFHTDEQESEGIMAYLRKCYNCCCYLCVHFFFSWINNGAYAYIHIAGDSFCHSATKVVSLKIQQTVATVIVTFMQALFSVLVKLGITAAACGVCAILMKNVEPYKNQITDLTGPLIIIGLIAFVISSLFVSLYSEGMEAIYVSFLADSDAGGADDKAPRQLLDVLSDIKKENHFVQ